MNHKEFFEEHGDDRSPYLYTVTIEQLYQAFKQRLVEELECRAKDGGTFLIDTTETNNER